MILQDEIHFSLFSERAVVTDTVKVNVQVILSVSGESDDQSNVRETILTSLKTIIDGDWGFTSLDRSVDRSGFEVISAVAQIRVKESEVNGITRRAKEISKPGLQLTVQNVDYNPTPAALEEARTALRKELLQKIQKEVVTYNKLFGGDDFNHNVTEGVWRISNVQFYEQSAPTSRPKGGARTLAASAVAMAYDSAGGSDDSGLELTQKVGLTANVDLARVAVKSKD